MSNGTGQYTDGGTIESGDTTIIGFTNGQKSINGGVIKNKKLIAISSPDPEIFHLLMQLREVPEVQSDQTLITSIDKLTTELHKKEPNLTIVETLWSIVQGSAAVSGAAGFVLGISKILGL